MQPQRGAFQLQCAAQPIRTLAVTAFTIGQHGQVIGFGVRRVPRMTAPEHVYPRDGAMIGQDFAWRRRQRMPAS